MRVLVVGGSGFVGSHAVDALLAAGHEVRVLDAAAERFRDPLPAVDLHRGLVRPGESLAPALDGCDAVVDALMIGGPDPVAAVVQPLHASLWLAAQARDAGVVAHCLLSSSAVYGHGPDARAAREDDLPAPINPYGAAKIATEHAVAALLLGSATRSVALRVANPYGERQDPARPQGVIGIALGRLADGRPMTVYGDMTRDFVHVTDVGRAVAHVLGTGLTGPCNVASGTGTAVVDVLRELERVSGRRLDLRREPGRAGEITHSVLDIGRARAAGWQPSVGLDEGLRRTWDWYRDRHEARQR